VTLLLAPDQVELYPPSGADAHGWALPGTAPSWSGTGNLQLSPGISDPHAADRGGAGPHGPAAVDDGTLYLPAEAPVTEGCGALIRGRMFALSNVRLIPDPTYPAGGLTCWAARASDTGGWPGDG
jgi:hypothetical protein